MTEYMTTPLNDQSCLPVLWWMCVYYTERTSVHFVQNKYSLLKSYLPVNYVQNTELALCDQAVFTQLKRMPVHSIL